MSELTSRTKLQLGPERKVVVWTNAAAPLQLDPAMELFVPVVSLPGPPRGLVQLEEDTTYQIFARDFPDGRVASFAFTSEDELVAWQPGGGPWIAMPLGELWELISESHDLLWVDAASTRTAVVEQLDSKWHSS